MAVVFAMGRTHMTIFIFFFKCVSCRFPGVWPMLVNDDASSHVS